MLHMLCIKNLNMINNNRFLIDDPDSRSWSKIIQSAIDEFDRHIFCEKNVINYVISLVTICEYYIICTIKKNKYVGALIIRNVKIFNYSKDY